MDQPRSILSKRHPKLHNNKLTFKQRSFSVAILESLEDSVQSHTHELQRALLISLPRTLQLTAKAVKLDPVAAAEVYKDLVLKSCLISNHIRKALLDTGAPQSLICCSSDRNRAKNSDGNFQTQPQWVLPQEDIKQAPTASDCHCYQCTAITGNKDSLRVLALLFSRGFLAEKSYSKAEAFWKLALPHKDAYFELAKFYDQYGTQEKYEQTKLDLYNSAAQLGHFQALYQIAVNCLESDTPKALDYLHKAASLGSFEAHLKLGECYSSGVGVEENPTTSVKHYLHAAEGGLVQGQWIVAQAYESGYGVDKCMDKALFWYLKAAEKDHAEAQRTLGYFYELGRNGEGVFDQDLKKAVYWYDRAAAQKDSIAMYNLSNIYWKGKGTEKNLDLAIYWCTEAAEQGDTAAQVRVAEIHHERGDTSLKDHEKMLYWLDLAASENNCKAQYLLGKFYMDGIGLAQDVPEGLAWYQEAATRGYPEAQFALAKIYKLGEVVEADENLCFSWCYKASRQGHPGATSLLGQLYDTGKGCKRDHNKAVQLYQEAASKKDSAAQFFLGYMYQHGTPLIQPDQKKALEMYILASMQGEKRAQANLGSMYKKGIAVSQDFQQAAFWYKKSAEQGHSRAQSNLGLLYENGLGVEKDFEEAAKWYFRSASQGNEKSQLRYALLCQQGLGVRQNEVEAVHWFECAAKQGNPVALYNMGRAYEDGILMEQNYPKALKMYEEAAEKGNSAAKLRLANMHEHGLGVVENETKALKFYEQAAKDGLVEAQVAFAVRLDQKSKSKEHLEQANYWFMLAAQSGHVSAQYYVATKAFESGQLDVAITWFEKSAAQGNLAAHVALSHIYAGLNDSQKLLAWTQSAAELGDNQSQLKMYRLLVEKNLTLALKYLTDTADKGYSEAEFELGNILLEGKLVDLDEVGSAHWYSIAANKNHVQACIKTAEAFLAGKGVPKSSERAIQYLEKAASLESIEAMEFLMEIYLKNKSRRHLLMGYSWAYLAEEYGSSRGKDIRCSIIKQNSFIEEEHLFIQQKARMERDIALLGGVGKSGSVINQFYSRGVSKSVLSEISRFCGNSRLMIGQHLFPEEESAVSRQAESTSIMYEKAVGYHDGSDRVPRDYSQARYWYLAAASNGHVASMYSLANMNLIGLGGKVNLEEAIKWYTSAADCNYLPAVKAIAALYNKGYMDELERDPVAAYCFFMQAVEIHGDAEAQAEINKLDVQDSGIRRIYQERKLDALEDRKLAFLSGFNGDTGAQSLLYGRLRQSEMFSMKIIRMVLRFAGNSCLLVRHGEDMLKFLQEEEIDSKQIEKRALNGDQEAQYESGLMYLKGAGSVKQDMLKGGYWLTAAAQQGHVQAMYKLGSMYEDGVGYKKDMERAITWYEEAGNAGSIDALKHLALMAKGGRGMDQDYLKAYCWLYSAWELGDIESKKELEAIETRERWVRREYNDLKATALTQRKMCFLVGLGQKGSLLHRMLRIRHNEMSESAGIVDSGVLRMHDIVGMVFEMSGDSMLMVTAGMDVTDFLKDNDDIDSDRVSVSKKARKDDASEVKSQPTNTRECAIQ